MSISAVAIPSESGFPARLAQKGLRIANSLAFLPPLLTRLILGFAFYQTGSGKWGDLDKTTSFFSDLGIPFARANATFIATLELAGGICLMLGLGTRIVALLLSSSMVVALLTADKESFVKGFPGGLLDVVPVVYGLFLLWLIVTGPGRLSVDHLIAKKLGIPERSDNE
jgi:putative oxidoreductase